VPNAKNHLRQIQQKRFRQNVSAKTFPPKRLRQIPPNHLRHTFPPNVSAKRFRQNAVKRMF
jgi:hypothetical protein